MRTIWKGNELVQHSGTLCPLSVWRRSGMHKWQSSGGSRHPHSRNPHQHHVQQAWRQWRRNLL